LKLNLSKKKGTPLLSEQLSKIRPVLAFGVVVCVAFECKKMAVSGHVLVLLLAPAPKLRMLQLEKVEEGG
jgi:hypothetical protein